MNQISLEDQLSVLITNENLCYSPLSLQIALAMLHMAADGESKLELERLGVHTLPELDYTDNDLAPAPENENSWDNEPAIVQFANSVWTNKNCELREDYAKDIKNKFNALSGQVDPDTAVKCAKMINDWVSKKTAGRIENLVPEDAINEDLITILVNALYVRASWYNDFDDSFTDKQKFTTLTESKDVDMMHQTDEIGYCNQEGVEAISLSTMDQYSLVCVKADTLENAILDPHSLEFKYTNMNLGLPKFKIETSLALKELLEKLGVTAIFKPSHDFTRLADVEAKMNVSEIIQKTFIEVHEKGLEAAAATAVIMVALSMQAPPPPPIDVVFDQPFMYYLVDTKNKVTLFAGLLVDPTAG